MTNIVYFVTWHKMSHIRKSSFTDEQWIIQKGEQNEENLEIERKENEETMFKFENLTKLI